MITPEMIFELLNKKSVLLTPEEVACVCNVDVKTLYNKKSKGTLPFPILNGLGRWQVRMTDLLSYLNQVNQPAYYQSESVKSGPDAREKRLINRAAVADKKIVRLTRKINTSTLVF